MEAQEFDTALTELETRVDRLRALYENWFRGYEKTEPSVARKDVERRVYGLRKELPRNTALRFRYHQVYQRFTTLATYWQRTARQVEEGTYRLQLQRLRRKKEDGLARSLPPPRGDEVEGETLRPKSYELNLDETLDVGQLLDDLELDQVARAIEAPGSHAQVQPAAPKPVVTRFARPPGATTDVPRARPSLTLESLEQLGSLPAMVASPANDREPFAATGAPPKGETLRAPVRASMIEESARRSSPMDTLGGVQISQLSKLESTPAQSGSGAPPLPSGRAPASPNGADKPSVPTATMGIPPRTSALQPNLPAPARPPAVPPATPPLARAAAPSQADGQQPAHPARLTRSPPLPVPAPPSAPRVGTAAAAPRAPSVPQPRAPLAPPAARPPSPTAASASGSGAASALSDQHIRRIYDDYVAARRKNNEGDVRFETLASSIHKMLPDLQKRHQGKRIDFEIVLKDGRVGLKPKAT
jgi:hypothetical protein